MRIADVHINSNHVQLLVRNAFKAAGVVDPVRWNDTTVAGNDLQRMERLIIRAIRKGIKAERERMQVQDKWLP